MRSALCLLAFSVSVAQAAEPPVVEKYLHAGDFINGEQALEALLQRSRKDDQLRFGLGVLRFTKAVERLGQSLYEYGAKTEQTSIPFLRLPVPKNPDPATITSPILRRVLEDMRRDLESTEKILAEITDDDVVLPLHLADVRIDLDGDGKANDKFIDLLKTMMRTNRFDFLKTNPHFLVKFDRGDVAWLRSYCHLLMGLLDVALAVDNEHYYNDYVSTLFAKAKKRDASDKDRSVIIVKEPARFERFRKHMLKVCELNRETWKHIRAETDDEFEWLPNARQRNGVLGLPVRDDMINTWHDMMKEFEALFNGERIFPKDFGFGREGKGLNMKTFLQDPPATIKDNFLMESLDDKYYMQGKEFNIMVLIAVWNAFDSSMGFGYAMWFN